MKNFLKRNAPVFIIGIVTLLIFVFIIIAAQKNNLTGPKLEKIERAQLITDRTPVKGNASASIYLVEFSDFECPACKSFHPIVKQLISKYGDKVILGYRHFPLPQHTNARISAQAAIAAHNQGKFWDYADILFENQPKLDRESLIKYAQDLKLDITKFEQDLDSDETKKEVETDLNLGNRVGVNSTPSFFLNGHALRITSIQSLEAEIIKALQEENVENIMPPTVEETSQSTQTSAAEDLSSITGDIIVEYTETGFVPSHIKVGQDQTITWKNKTNNPIKIEQIIKTYEALKYPVTIEAGKNYTMKMTHENLWTYKESDHKHYGSVFVLGKN